MPLNQLDTQGINFSLNFQSFGYEGNEATDELCKRRSSRSFDITKSQMTKSTNEWIHKKSRSAGKNHQANRQAKQFLEEQKPKFTKDLLNKNRKTIKMLTHMRSNNLFGKIALLRYIKQSLEKKFFLFILIKGVFIF